MKPLNARKVSFQQVILFGNVVLFTTLRINTDSIPNNLFVYQIRHDPSGEPKTLEKSVRVDYFGTIISNKEIKLTLGNWENDMYAKIHKLDFEYTNFPNIDGGKITKYFENKE